MAPIMVKKQYGFTASVVRDTNTVIGCSRADWSSVRDGSFIILGSDKVFYRVADKRRFSFEKEVTVIHTESGLNNSKLKIDYNIGALLNVEDEISFIYSELHGVSASVSSGGQGYVVGDVIKPEGGVCKYNSLDEIDAPFQAEVLAVDASGGVTSIKIKSEGLYILAPQPSDNAVGGSGSGCVLNITFRTKETRPIEERSIENITLSEGSTVIELNHPLPPRLNSGVIKTEKWELSLSANYSGESRFNSHYEIVKDFTPNYNLPLMYSDLKSSHMVYNEAIAILDQRIKAIEDKL
jgi:hypothetical protein